LVTRRELGPGPFLADTSAWARASDPGVEANWIAALVGGRLVTTPIVVLELLRSDRGLPEVERRLADLAQLRSIPLTQSVARAAVQAVHDLAALGAGYHRLPPADLLVAAAAQEAAVAVLHYDHHYDRLAEVLHFESRWIAAPGSL
jgi:predicted nucleic acid-binding protein